MKNLNHVEFQMLKVEGKEVLNSELIGLFQADEGGIESWTGGIGEGKTYGACKRAVDDLLRGKVVYTSWPMILDHFEGDQRKSPFYAFWNFITFKKRFYHFDLKKNWHYIDYEDENTWYIDYKEKPLDYYSVYLPETKQYRVKFDDFVEFITNLTDCTVYLDEGQDIFDSYEGTKMSKKKRKVLTRTRHLRKTLVIISQRYQAIPPTARRNVKTFHKHVKAFTLFGKPYFKVYSTQELDNSEMPIFDPEAKASDRYWAKQEIFNTFNSWYLRGGIPISQDLHFTAYDFSFGQRLLHLFSFFAQFALKRKRAEKISEQSLGDNVTRTTLKIVSSNPKGIVSPIQINKNSKLGSIRRDDGGEKGYIDNTLELPF